MSVAVNLRAPFISIAAPLYIDANFLVIACILTVASPSTNSSMQCEEDICDI